MLFEVPLSTPPIEDEKNPAPLESGEMPLPEGLQDLHSRASEGLSQSQKQVLHRVLWEHQEAFTSTSKCLGKMAIVEHEIDTGEH